MVDSNQNPDTFAADDAEFKKIATQRYMYNAEKCGKAPLVGNLLNLLDMPPILRTVEGVKKLVPWQAFLIRTTRPTKGLDRDKKVVDVGVGEEVLIPATYELQQFMTKAATNADMIFEVRIVPRTQLDIGGGQSMWLFDLAAKPKPQRRGAFGLAAVLAPSQLPAASSSGSDDSESSGASDSDIPW